MESNSGIGKLTDLVWKECSADELVSAFNLKSCDQYPTEGHGEGGPETAGDVDKAFSLAVFLGRQDLVESMLNLGIKVNVHCRVRETKGIDSPSDRIETPLITAVRLGHHKIMELLLQHGAEVNGYALDCHMNALHWACHKGDLKAVRMLVQHNADIESRSDYNFTPLLEALINKHCDVVEFLLWKGCDLSPVTTLHNKFDQEENEGEPEDEQESDSNGLSALTMAFTLQLNEVVKLLVQAGCDLRLTEEIGDILGSYMTSEHPKKLFQLLLMAGTRMTCEFLLALPTLHHKYPDCAQWLETRRKQPLPLMELCRLDVRARLRMFSRNRAILHLIISLPVPQGVKDYLCMLEI